MAWIEANLALSVAGAALLLVLLGWLLLARRRTRVRLSRGDDGSPARRNQALIDTPPVAQAAPAPAPASDLSRIKGLGPKLAAQLEALGITSVAQIAAWDDAAIDRIDAQLGRFAGRIRQDDWVAQARLLEAGDVASYEARFGRR